MNVKFGSLLLSRFSLTFILACIHFFAFGTAISSTAGGGNWTLTTSWVGGVVPVLGDDVTIVNGATINLTTSQSCNSLTLNGSGILNMNTATRTLTVTTGVTLNGTSQIQGTGFDRIINAATLTIAAAATTTIQDIQINTSGVATLNGTVAFTVGNSASKSFASMTINGGGILNMSTNNVTVGVVGALTLNGTGTIQGNNNNRIVNVGSLSVSSGAAAIIQNVQFNVTNAATIDGTLTFNTGNTATKSFGSLTINSPSGTFTNTANNVPITINGSMVNNGTFSQGTGRVTFTGATSNTVTGTAATTAFGGGITINKGASQANILDVQCVITMLAGGLTLTKWNF